MSSEVLNLQQQFYNMEKSNQQRIQGLQEALTNERKLHKTAEEELGLRIQVLKLLHYTFLFKLQVIFFILIFDRFKNVHRKLVPPLKS